MTSVLAIKKQPHAEQSLLAIVVAIWRHLRRKRQLQFYFLLGLMIVGSFAEIMSIGAVFPLLGILTVPDKIFQHSLAQPFVHLLNIQTPQQLVLPTVLAFSVIALFAGFIRLLMIYANTRYSHAVGADLSVDIYRRTLYQPYAAHAAMNSSELIGNITAKSTVITGSVLTPLLNLMSSSLLIGGVVAALVAIDPSTTAIIFVVVGGAYGVIIAGTRRALRSNSEVISRETTQVIKSLQEGLGGIRDVLIGGTQEVYVRHFQTADRPLRLAHGYNQFIGAAPRYVVETMGMITIAGFAYFASGQTGGIDASIPTLGALALGAQRLLPMLQLGYSSFATIRGAVVSSSDVLEVLDQQLPDYIGRQVDPIRFKSHIALQYLDFSHNNNALVLTNVNLRMARGGRYGFVGKTGSGKSTLMDILMGLLEPTKGYLSIDGQILTASNRRNWQKRIAHVPQFIYLSDATLAENIAFGVPVDQIDIQRVTRAAKLAKIASVVEAWPLKYQTMVGERGARLSGGQRQRIGIARALYQEADVLVFDEATSALDNETEKAVMNAIEGLPGELTVLIVAHRLSTLKNCDEVYEVIDGVVLKTDGGLNLNGGSAQ